MTEKILSVLFILLIVLCSAALAEDNIYWTKLDESELQTLEKAGETVLAPDYSVPSHVICLLEVAKAELGYTEQRGNVTKYGTWAGDPQAEWCAEYLCWCVDQTDQKYGYNLLNQVYPKYSGTNIGLRWFLRQGRYIARKGTVPDYGSQWLIGHEENMEKNSYVPQPGDWMFFSSLASGDTTHVAMVEYCTVKADGSVRVHVLEGNRPDKVQQYTYRLDDEKILGYGTVYDLADIVLRQGQEGVKVTALQQLLCDIGLLDASYVDGRYGQHTADAVRAFQKMENVQETGIANHHTQLALQKYALEYYKTHPDFYAVDETSDADAFFREWEEAQSR